jgi:hypothetical protein
MDWSTAAIGERPEFAVRSRFWRLQAGLTRPFVRSFRVLLIALAFGAGLAVVVTAASRSPLIGAMSGLAAAALVGALGLLPFTSPGLRGALELINDHHAHEQAEWRAETGTKIPVGIRRQEQWLVDHPAGPGRATVLLALGRLTEADEAIGQLEPATPQEQFGVEILRETSRLLAGQRPALGALAESWKALPDPIERRHRRECLALLEALVAVADHQDPTAVLAAARREVGEVSSSMRLQRILGRWAAVGAGVIVVAAFVGLAFT